MIKFDTIIKKKISPILSKSVRSEIGIMARINALYKKVKLILKISEIITRIKGMTK